MPHPPNIHEIESIVLLRQALDVLAAEASVQRSLYPEDRDPGEEMALLYRDAWSRVEPVFEPILERSLLEGLRSIQAKLADEAPDWDSLRGEASRARDGLPGKPGEGRPRPWLDQMVLARNQLLLRRQV